MGVGRERRYVDVIARWRDDGGVVPLSVCWPDGRTFDVESVLGRASDAFPGAPGRVVRYSVRVSGCVTQLFLEYGGDNAPVRWYVETSPGAKLWKFGGGGRRSQTPGDSHE